MFYVIYFILISQDLRFLRPLPAPGVISIWPYHRKLWGVFHTTFCKFSDGSCFYSFYVGIPHHFWFFALWGYV